MAAKPKNQCGEPQTRAPEGPAASAVAGTSAMPASYPTAAETFLRMTTNEINKDDVKTMVQSQEHMLMRFEKTNEMLLNFNSLSTARYEATCRDFKQHTQLLIDMKKELDSIFKRIRVVKTKLSQQHPEAFKVCSDIYNMLEVEEMAEGSQASATSAAAAAAANTAAGPSHPAALSEVPPGTAVTNLGVVESPAVQQMSDSPQVSKTETDSKRMRDKKRDTSKKASRSDVRKSWPVAKPPSKGTVKSGVAVVIAGEEDDSD